MRKLFLTGILTFIFTITVFAQLKHTIVKGETLYSISKKYQVTPEEITKLNPEIKKELKENATITIPVKSKKEYFSSDNKSKFIKNEYVVQNGETLYAISRKLGVSVDELIKNNPVAKNGISPGQKLTYLALYKTRTTEKFTIKKEIPLLYKIQAQETKYSLSKKFDISISELERLNPHIKTDVKTGDTIRLTEKIELPKSSNIVVENRNVTDHFFDYTVQSGETLYSISKKNNVTIEKIIEKNPSVTQGLSTGFVLKLPLVEGKQLAENKDSVTGNKRKVNLLETVNFSKERNLVLLMPFNINRIENDSTKTKIEYLKSDKFLNITLDFYAGALKAIDSAKVLGLPIKVKVFDAESSKYSSNVTSIIKNNDFSTTDLVIGPFTNSFVETAGELLIDKNIPIISPLMKDGGKGGKNVFYAMPSEDIQREELFNYLKSKSDAIFAIHSSVRTPLSEYIANKVTGVKSYSFNDKGILDFTTLKAKLIKGKKNFIILDSDKIMQVLSAVNQLIGFKKEFDIQLVVTEFNDALDFEDVTIKKLASLKLLYPSAIRENDSKEALNFASAYRKDNKVMPNQYATRGFDVTFDAILRMCQENGFSATVDEVETEQIESQFNYVNNNNRGVYMLYYNDDLTIKQAK